MPDLAVAQNTEAAENAENAENNVTYLTPPRTEASEAYQKRIQFKRVVSEIKYVDTADKSLLEDIPIKAPKAPAEIKRRAPVDIGGMGPLLIVVLLVAALFLFLKFGAGGLLAAEPKAPRSPRKPAKAWGLESGSVETNDLMSQLRAMADRRDAMVLLLRHCLLRAATDTDVGFARSDTEREALGRIPERWRLYTELRDILFATELVHYGGRPMGDAEFGQCLDQGAQILRIGADHE